MKPCFVADICVRFLLLGPVLFASTVGAEEPKSMVTAPTRLILAGHAKPMVDFQFAPDGKVVVSMAADGETILWDLSAATGRRLTSLPRKLKEGRYLHFTREKEPILLAGCIRQGLGIDLTSGRAVGEYGSRTYLSGYSIVPAGGRRLLVPYNSHVMEAHELGAQASLFKQPRPSNEKWLVSPTQELLLIRDPERTNQLKLLELPSGKERAVLKGFRKSLRDFLWLPDGQIVCLEAETGDVTLWNVDAVPQLKAKVTVGSGVSHSHELAVSRNGEVIAVNGAKDTTHLMAIRDGSFVPLNTVKTVPPYELTADGTRLIAGSISHRWQTVIIDVTTGATLATVKRESDEGQTWPRFSPDGGDYIVGYPDGTVRFHPISGMSSEALTQIAELPVKSPMRLRKFKAGTITFSPDATMLVTRSLDNHHDRSLTIARIADQAQHLAVWETKVTISQGVKRQRIDLVDHRAFVFLPDGNHCVECGGYGQSKNTRVSPINGYQGTIDLRTGELRARENKALVYFGMGTSPDGTLGAAISIRQGGKPSCTLIESQTGKILQTLIEEMPMEIGYLNGQTPIFVFSSNGERLAVNLCGKNSVWDLKAKKQLPLQDDRNYRLFWLTEEGQRFVYVKSEGAGVVRGIDLATNQEAFTWRPEDGQSGGIAAIDFSLNGKLAVCGSGHGEISIRDARTGAVLFQQKAFANRIVAVGFSHDAAKLAATDEDRNLIVWKLGSLAVTAQDEARIVVDATPAPAVDE